MTVDVRVLVASLRRSGVRFEVLRGRLCVSATSGRHLPEPARLLVVEHAAEIKAVLELERDPAVLARLRFQRWLVRRHYGGPPGARVEGRGSGDGG